LVFEGCREYIKIITKEGKPIITLESMKNIESIMPKSDFIRVHKSYIVSTKSISALSGNTVELGTFEIPIGGSYKEALMEFLKA
jgi:DNA-binding LytR/AlgR family response regulator